MLAQALALAVVAAAPAIGHEAAMPVVAEPVTAQQTAEFPLKPMNQLCSPAKAGASGGSADDRRLPTRGPRLRGETR